MRAGSGVASANMIGGSSESKYQNSRNSVHARLFALASAWAVFFFVGVRSVVTNFNPDYLNYEVIITGVQRSEDWLFSLFLAKDLSFLLLIKLGALIHEGVLVVFILIAVATFIAKAIVAAKALRKPFAFAVLYAVLLAPGLDLAAIRACLALSLLAVALSCETRRAMLFVYLAAALSHVSVLTAVPALLKKAEHWVERKPWSSQICFVCAGLAVYPIASIFERSADYEGNASTAFGLMLTALTPIAVNVARLLTATRRHTRFSIRCLIASLTVTSLGLGLAPASITMSTRLSEIGSFLLLLCLCSARNGYGARFWIPVAAASMFPVLRNTMVGIWISLVM
jgi:hypothetical protein